MVSTSVDGRSVLGALAAEHLHGLPEAATTTLGQIVGEVMPTDYGRPFPNVQKTQDSYEILIRACLESHHQCAGAVVQAKRPNC